MSTVLVADDDPDIRDLVCFKLRQAGHRVLDTGDGTTALNLATRELPDLAIIDVTMPGMDGIEICSRLRADERTQAMPVVLLTARAGAADTEGGKQAGATDYITKPFSPRDLVRRVEDILSGSARES